MYLTRTFINPRRQGAVRYLGSPQLVHASVLQAFPRTPPTDAAAGPRVLWRLDTDDWRRPVLWMVSPDKPDLHHVVDPYGWPASDAPFESREYAPLLDRIAEGHRYVFRATVNPTKTQPGKLKEGLEDEGRRERGTVVPLVGADSQIGWFADRARGWGFELLRSSAPLPVTALAGDGAEPEMAYAVETRDSRKLRFWRSAAKSRPVVIRTVTLEGLLRVTDPEAFRRTLTGGIGRAKAYGCGLVTLASAHR
ncbi:type I-E CRISPR-associated protein Cas6/Cse3/CasE [Nocardiopsis mangrovi]|uniref:Type I-E CRISPR-associated protein Cas6/Cse3/CasE n=1 Tax=Nocardiopsis mangrovi TaxID=1179818 RepID=A0ABV9DZ25_9ACTN